MTPSEIGRLRLRHQQIELSTCPTPAEVVRHLGAMQSQDYGNALWSIGLRTAGATEAQVEQAIADRHIVRTWPMRGTLHFVAAGDVRWLLQHLTPKIIAGAATRHGELEIDQAYCRRCEKALVQALTGGGQLTRSEVFAVLERAGMTVDAARGYHTLWRLAQHGLLCFGARRGKDLTYTLLEEWIPPGRSLDRAEALAELAQRYFTSHGPAGVRDFAWWAGLTLTDARAGLASVADQLSKETVGDTEYWFNSTVASAAPKSSNAWLLPGFDEYLLGYQDRSAVLAPQHANKIVPGGNGIFLPTMVSQGQVIGTWKRTVKKKSVAIIPLPFAPLKKAQAQAFTRPAKHYGQFLGLAPELASAD